MKRHGLTLLETLAATVLLSLLAAAALPAITSSLAIMAEQGQPLDHSELSQLADQFVSDPASFGFKTQQLREFDEFQLRWPPFQSGEETPNRRCDQLTVQILRAESEDIDHCWLIFRCEDNCVARWMALPPVKNQTGGPS